MASTRSNRPGALSGQASVEFIAVLPALAVCLILAGQAETAARHALPGPLRRDAVIRSGDGVRVKVRVPALVPGVVLPSVVASSTLDADHG